MVGVFVVWSPNPWNPPVLTAPEAARRDAFERAKDDPDMLRRLREAVGWGGRSLMCWTGGRGAIGNVAGYVDRALLYRKISAMHAQVRPPPEGSDIAAKNRTEAGTGVGWMG